MNIPDPPGYLATPSTSSGRPILVLHAWWGLNETIKSFCNRLATEGFVAFAPDLFDGRLARTIPEAEALSGSANHESVKAQVVRALRFLLLQRGHEVGNVSVIGFSFGAFFALDLSVTLPEEIKSVVVFYGTRPGDYVGSTAEYCGHFAANDPFEPKSEVENLHSKLVEAGCSATFHTYPGTGHWFFEHDRSDAYDDRAAKLAWERTVEFLNRNK